MAKNRILICIPTYNEYGNIQEIYRKIRDLNFPADLLFVDDNSPDGTGKIIDQIVQEDPGCHVLHRPIKSGIGSAHLLGIQWASYHGYEKLITMDCDFSHSPGYLYDFLKYSEDNDIVVGSRYMKKDSLKDWSPMRKILTNIGHSLTYLFLRMPYDATGAFRLYHLNNIPPGIFNLVQSRGYSFFFESLFILHYNKFSIKEFPIHLPARTYGHSKMKFKDALQSLKRLGNIFLRTKFKKRTIRYSPSLIELNQRVIHSRPQFKDGPSEVASLPTEWDRYWSGKRGFHVTYDLLAGFFRKFLIKPTLNHFIKKHFKPNSHLLHAGCGSGQVDVDIAKMYKITALDISLPALHIYKKTVPEAFEAIHGDIFSIPLEDEVLDGIYNLGVMEHFTEDQIQKILLELRRVLKPNGKMVIFWPPEFGLSVNVLKATHFLLHRILQKNIKLFPDEITRVKSKNQIESLFKRGQFRLLDYYFGWRDGFTCVAVAVEKTS